MDERQQQIREGAGLEESRLNVEFIDFLRKYSTPVLMVIAIAAVAYWGLNRWQQAKVRRLDAAYEQLTSAVESGSPDSLVAVAADYSDVGAVPHLARLTAAEIHLSAYRTGVAPGGQLNPDGSIAPDPGTPAGADGTTPPGKGLSEAERATHLEQAGRLYEEVLAGTKNVAGMPIQAINSLFGLAAVAECRSDWEGARTFYAQIKERATSAGFPDLSIIATNRAESLDRLKDPPKVYELSQLPKPPAPAAAAPIPVNVPFAPPPSGPAETAPSGPPPGADAVAPSGEASPTPAPSPEPPAPGPGR
ncbi:MAG: hypothetical protein KF745_06200 [Phycisphaeraceae bacterium]|nr:hypothetical protein [Phycisphaeraceae bacterium]